MGIGVDDGKLLWKVGYRSRYNSGTPIVDGQTVIYSGPGPGTVALKIEKQGDVFTAKQLWKKPQAAGIYNTPVLKDGLLYGLAHAERPQHAHPVGMQQDACPGGMPHWAALNKLHPKTVLVQCRCQGEPGDSSPDD